MSDTLVSLGNLQRYAGRVKTVTDGKLSTTGGTMTGSITTTAGANIKQAADNSELIAFGGTTVFHGAHLALRGMGFTTSPGTVELVASDGTLNKDLVLYPNGSFTWVGKEVERVNASGTGYIRYESGFQVCWGAGGYSGSVNFPIAFVSNPTVLVTRYGGAYGNAPASDNPNTTGFTCYADTWVSYVAIGRWK